MKNKFFTLIVLLGIHCKDTDAIIPMKCSSTCFFITILVLRKLIKETLTHISVRLRNIRANPNKNKNHFLFN